MNWLRAELKFPVIRSTIDAGKGAMTGTGDGRQTAHSRPAQTAGNNGKKECLPQVQLF